MTNVYQVNIEGNVEEVSTIAEVKSLIGDTKVTKKAIEAGEYPMVTIATEPALELDEESTEEVVATLPENLDGLEVGKYVHVYKDTDDTDLGAWLEDNGTVHEVTEFEVDNQLLWVKDCDYAIQFEDVTAIVDAPTEEDTTDESTEEDGVEDDTEEEDTVDEPTEELPAEYVVGAMAILSDDSQNEEFIEWLFEEELPNDEVTISAVDKASGNIEVKGYDGAVHYTDLTVTAPPKAKGKGKNTSKAPNPDVDGYPEVGYFAEEADIKKYIKKLSYEQLEEWCKQANAEYNLHDNPSINRMRMAMAIKAKHFTHLAPGNGKSKSGKKSKYAQYTNEDLAQMCLDNDVEVRDAKGDARIERMYMITDLRKANVID